MSKADNTKNSEMAKRMKEQGIKRDTMACPMSCGKQIRIGAQALNNHLGRCGR